ncbi:LuxR C-terminal-related transcriptional regulator [Nonomuraea endophytica]|uniref:Putative ATPase/DNA-binding CsgD family transcriptional regulator n=1 Tax=Nonomuraea endophytica TaxID=714136 RepID=A0A7W8A136_9ACTN|nr:LuxR C-terminal-related transcriptional regulator [Nonomuraea endophytica]MBB5077044.1 putative ATPase/DNA-binding CsgD family transcriptional regulator [Nonomuraea endophytica]
MVERGRGNLPAEFTSMIGRAAEVAEGLRALTRTRLLTVTGPGGVGKSRVGVRIARHARRRFPGGIWYAELSAVTGEPALTARVAAAIGRPQARTAEGIAAALRERRALVVLDTCEHLAGPVARLVAVMLRRAPEVKIVVTGRQPLDLAGQRLLYVRPLAEADAVTLFAERAAAVDPDFSLSVGTRAAVAEICRRLDGLPLAIELAAACLRSLTAPELRERLRDRWPLLAAGTTSALPRQRDLRAMVEWSHALCGAEQRVLWAALSVVDGGFERQTAEAIGVEAGLPRVRVGAVLGDLVASSVVLREPMPGGAGYRLLQPYRQVGLELLEARARTRLTARYGAATATPVPRPDGGRETGDVVLSPRELQVAELITEGLTNLEIAGRLVISKRTVDAHVRNILAKGHLTSRTHVAAWMVSHD